MQISGASESLQVQGLSLYGGKDMPPPPPKTGTSEEEDCCCISEQGRFQNMMSGLSEEEKDSLVEFIDELMAAVESGDVDTGALAESAPALLKTFAEENGIDLEEMIGRFEERMSEVGAGESGLVYSPDGVPIPDAEGRDEAASALFRMGPGTVGIPAS